MQANPIIAFVASAPTKEKYDIVYMSGARAVARAGASAGVEPEHYFYCNFEYNRVLPASRVFSFVAFIKSIKFTQMNFHFTLIQHTNLLILFFCFFYNKISSSLPLL